MVCTHSTPLSRLLAEEIDFKYKVLATFAHSKIDVAQVEDFLVDLFCTESRRGGLRRNYVNMSRTMRPWTSVRRKSRPWKR